MAKHEHWILVLRKHPLHDDRSQSSWNNKPEPYHGHSWTNHGHWVHIVIRKKNQYELNCITQN